jgi:hypothetical protein
MTTPLTTPAEPPLPRARVGLTAADAERIATAVEAELAASTCETYACGWRQWERWCRGRDINPLPAPPEAVAAFLAERAEAGVHFSTLDCYCPGIAHRHRQEGLTDPTADVLVRRVRRGLRRILGSRRSARATRSLFPNWATSSRPPTPTTPRTSATGPSCSSGTPPR